MRCRRALGWVARAVRWGLRALMPAVVPRPTQPADLPGRITRGAVGGAAFLLVTQETTPAPSAAPAASERLIAEARARFRLGGMFAELGRAAMRGAVITCRIREEGAVTADHVLVICPIFGWRS